jgi:hypothetical protein
MNRIIITLIVTAILSGCATQRYGREKPISAAEKSNFTCKDVALQTASTEEFLSDLRMQRADTSGAHVLGALGDFGIGNVMEGDAAELSGEKRLKELRELKASKGC